MSKKRKQHKRNVGRNLYAPSVFISHSNDDDHQNALRAAVGQVTYVDSNVILTGVELKAVADFVFVADGRTHPQKARSFHYIPWTMDTRSSFTLSTAAEFVLLLMSRQRRNDVWNDMRDWYPQWTGKYGHFSARIICWWKIAVAVFGGLLDVTGRIAEIVGKFRGAK